MDDNDRTTPDNPDSTGPQHGPVISPTPYNPQVIIDTINPAVELIRSKLTSIYNKEPDVQKELEEVQNSGPAKSPHQQFIYDLSLSGLSLADIQTAWHEYYVSLDDEQKHQVWQEFYTASGSSFQTSVPPPQSTTPGPQHQHPEPEAQETKWQPIITDADDLRSVGQLKQKIIKKIQSRTKLQANHHVKSLLFGLSMGCVTVAVLLFGFFNERFIAPFITPSRNVSATPIIVDQGSDTNVGPDPRIIIPKINVEVPVVYDAESIEEKAIQNALERGVVHYKITSKPGEQGNTVIVGHSSNNILNRGKYKFAFVLLNRLEAGDTFMLTKDGKRYTYKVFDKRVVQPSDISVLNNPSDKRAIATLITCDPPGTSLNRLVVIAEQILPDPNANTASSAPAAPEEPAILPSNAPSLWQRVKDWFS